MTLLEFLQERLTEDELIALAAIDGSPQWHGHLAYRDVAAMRWETSAREAPSTMRSATWLGCMPTIPTTTRPGPKPIAG